MEPLNTYLSYGYIDCLEDQHEKFQQAVDSSPVSVIITDKNGTIEYVNPKFTRLTGYSLGEAAGKNTSLLESGLTPTRVYRKMEQTLSQGRHWSGELISRKKNGETYYEHAHISPMKNDDGEITHYVTVKEDITARKKAEEEREEMRVFLQNVIDWLPEPVMVINTDYRVTLMNAKARNMGGFGPETSSPFCYQISHSRESPCSGDDHPCPLHEVIKTRKSTSMEHKHYGPDGEIHDVELIAAPYLDKYGTLKGIIETTRDITKRKITENNLDYLAHYDQLTKTPNRIMFHERLEQALALAQREDSGLALLFIDLDGFKSINDNYGHAIGDLLLEEVARRLKKTLRNSDTVGRIGGDEFIIILHGVKNSAKATKVACKVLNCLKSPYCFDQLTCKIGASIGISVYPDDGEEKGFLVKKADKAMYAAKKDPHTSIASWSDL